MALYKCAYDYDLLDGVKFGRVHSPPRGLTHWRCGLLSTFFDNLLMKTCTDLSSSATLRQSSCGWSVRHDFACVHVVTSALHTTARSIQGDAKKRVTGHNESKKFYVLYTLW